ncbi:MAG: hypothetical protein K2R98_00440 [Gemmataceae bacterium]|nr:hypothetical protein [Gemmataceae bacterium]
MNPVPNAAPFATAGEYVAPETVVCLIESMSIFNEITAGVHGVVTEVLVSNGDPVEFNQVLFRVSRPPDPLDLW